jgi:hypothetical protein
MQDLKTQISGAVADTNWGCRNQAARRPSGSPPLMKTTGSDGSGWWGKNSIDLYGFVMVDTDTKLGKATRIGLMSCALPNCRRLRTSLEGTATFTSAPQTRFGGKPLRRPHWAI